MRAHELLLEYDRSRTLAKLAADPQVIKGHTRQIYDRLTDHDWVALYEKWKEEGREELPGGVGGPSATLERYCKAAIGRPLLMALGHKKPYSDPDPDMQVYWDWVLNTILTACEEADPTSKNKFVPQILNWWFYGIGAGMSYLEDIGKAYEPLQTYVKFKNRITGLDLMSTRFEDFWDKMEAIASVPSNSVADRAEMQAFFDDGEASLLLDNDRVRVVIPRTEAAAKYFGKNTRWCTSAQNNNQFATYQKYGELYIILFKAENVRWQWCFEVEQFMDAKDVDNQADIRETLPQYPELMDIWDAQWRKVLTGRSSSSSAGQTEVNMNMAIGKMFRPTLEDWTYLFDRCIYVNRALKPEVTWNLVHPLQDRKVVELAREHWFNARGAKPPELGA